MLPGYKDVTSVLTHLGKRGQAIVRINVVAYANDTYFGEDPPSCSLTVTVTDPHLPGDPIQVVNADIPTTFSPFQHDFVIVVETTVSVLKGIFMRRKPRALLVSIEANPISGFEEFYESDMQNPIVIEAGTIVSRSVSLKPKATTKVRRRHSQLDEPSRRAGRPEL